MKYNIKENIAEKQLYYKGEVIINYTIKYPETILNDNQIATRKYNHLNRKQALLLKEFIENEFYNEAQILNNYNKQNMYPSTIFKLICDIDIT